LDGDVVVGREADRRGVAGRLARLPDAARPLNAYHGPPVAAMLDCLRAVTRTMDDATRDPPARDRARCEGVDYRTTRAGIRTRHAVGGEEPRHARLRGLHPFVCETASTTTGPRPSFIA
jgi:hypothetical protein